MGGEVKFEKIHENKPLPPDGGWGYVVTASIVVLMCVTMVPTTSFGLYYGPFLSSIGDETDGTALLTSIYLAVVNTTGFASSFLLRKYSVRLVGIIGAISFLIGGITETIGTKIWHMIIAYSLLKGFGYGVMQPASFTILNSYFDKKHNLMMGVSQTIISLGTIICPMIMAYVVKHMGFRKVVGVLTGLSLLNFPAIFTFRSVRHRSGQKSPETSSEKINETLPPTGDHSKSQTKPLLPSISEVEGRVPTVGHKNPSFLISVKMWLLDTIGLRLFGDLRYLNMAFGLAVSFNSDYNFTVIIRMVLNNLNYDATFIAKTIMVYFGCDLISRILYSVISYFWKINNRMVFLIATFVIALLRVAFIVFDGYVWKTITIGLVGLSRGFIETPLPLVVSEMYKDDFSTAFSLYMVLTGFLGLISGYITSYVKDVTQSDAMIIYLFAVANLIVGSAWIMESIFGWVSRRKPDNVPTTQLENDVR